MEKDKLKELIKLVQQFKGYLTLSYIPSSVLDSTKKVYGIYYGGWTKIEIGNSYRDQGEQFSFIDITDENIDDIVDKIYKTLNDSIGNEILQAIDNLKLDTEDLKYFDRDPELFKNFKKEVRKLKKT